MSSTKQNYIPIPEEYPRKQLNTLYREIPLKATTSRLLRKYFTAMANLYGIITLRKAFEIISSQNPDLVTEKEFLAFAKIARHEDEGYYILGKHELFFDAGRTHMMSYEIIDISLFDGEPAMYIEMKKLHIPEKKYYIPSKEQFLLYNDPMYCEEMPKEAEFKDFFGAKVGLNDHQKNVMLDMFWRDARHLGLEYRQIMAILKKAGIVIADEDMAEFLDICSDYLNSIKMQCNLGYSPQEILDMLRPNPPQLSSLALESDIRAALKEGRINIDEFREMVLQMDLEEEYLECILKAISDATKPFTVAMPNVASPNSPCPCGSGKKYKKCCGMKK